MSGTNVAWGGPVSEYASRMGFHIILSPVLYLKQGAMDYEQFKLQYSKNLEIDRILKDTTKMKKIVIELYEKRNFYNLLHEAEHLKNAEWIPFPLENIDMERGNIANPRSEKKPHERVCAFGYLRNKASPNSPCQTNEFIARYDTSISLKDHFCHG